MNYDANTGSNEMKRRCNTIQGISFAFDEQTFIFFCENKITF